MEVQVDVWLGVIRWLISRANRPKALKRIGFSEGGLAIIVHPVEVTPDSRLPTLSLLQSHSRHKPEPSNATAASFDRVSEGLEYFTLGINGGITTCLFFLASGSVRKSEPDE